MQSVVWAMVFFVGVGGITSGPVNVLASSLGARWGWRGAWPHVLGASLGYCAMVAAMGGGLQIVLQQRPSISHALQWLGAAYLLYLAFRIGTAKPSAGSHAVLHGARPAAPQGLWNGFLTQTLNPKGWLVAMSGVGMFVVSDSNPRLYLLLYCTISLLVCFMAVSVWAGLGMVLQQWLAQPQHQRWFNRACGAALAACVLPMVRMA